MYWFLASAHSTMKSTAIYVDDFYILYPHVHNFMLVLFWVAVLFRGGSKRLHFTMSHVELDEEYANQESKPTRRFERPAEVLAYNTDQKSNKEEKVTMDVCIMDMIDATLCWYVYFIQTIEGDNFPKRNAILLKLSDERKTKFVFWLCLWKAKKQSRDHASGDGYTPGKSYVVTNVNGLHLHNQMPQGLEQARFVVKS